MRILYAFLLLSLLSCSTSSPKDWKTWDLGGFRITVPKNCQLIEEKSTDSYVARIKGEGIELMFDYGPYSPEMTLTPEEYMQKEEWLRGTSDFALLYAAITPTPKLLEVKKISDSTYQATFNAKDCLTSDSCVLNTARKLFDSSIIIIKDSLLVYHISLPKEYREFDFTLTESDSIFKRIFIPKQLNHHSAGVYMINKNSCLEDVPMHCPQQLALWTSDTVRISRSDLERILASVKLNSN